MSPRIVLVLGGGWRNLRVKDLQCKPCSYQTDIPNNDLGFRTFRNAREPAG